MILLSLCDLDAPIWLIIWWFLPFLLGLLLGYLIWSRWKSRFEEKETELGEANLRITELDSSLRSCEAKRMELDNELVLLRSEIREMKEKTDITNKTERVFKGEEPSSGADPSSQSITQSSGKGSASIYSALSEKNLQVIEGIGPKMASILKENGIHSWSDLANSTVGQLQQILDSFGTRYRIIDPSTWTEQARLASEGEWETLVSYQKSLSGGVNKGGEPTDSKVEKLLIKIGVLKKWKPDDLKAIEGIGPKTEELLHSYGIDTWWKLAKTETSKLQSILNEAGDRFALVDPGTWSKQARLAAEGDWKALEKYQDKLKWGKE